jgi:O-antigen/teichoic acid export membrane protein
MSTKLFRSSAWLFLARLWAQGGMALFIVLAARRLGGSGFGEYSFMAALVVIGNILTAYGTDMHLIREIAVRGSRGQLPAALALQGFLSILFATGVFLAAPHLTFLSSQGALALRIYSLALFPLAFYTVFTTALRGEQQMGVYASLNALVASLQLLAAVIFYFSSFDLVGLAILLLAAQALAAFLAGLLCSLYIPGFWRGWVFSYRDVSRLSRASAPLALLSGLAILYQRLSPALLPFISGIASAGFFSAPSRVVEAAKVGHLAVFTALYPAMAERKGRDRHWFQSYRPEGLALLAVAALASLGCSLLAGPLITWLFGVEYHPSIPVLKILAWTLLPYTVNGFLSLAFLANGDEAAVLAGLSTGLLALAALTAWWGKAGGAQGAAWAVLYAECLQAAVLSFQAARRLRGAAVVSEEV